MKPVYKCDYCSFMGTAEEVKEHEQQCTENYDMMNCFTCKHRGKICMENGKIKYECEKGIDVPAGCVNAFCKGYEQKEKLPSIANAESFFRYFGL